jgi:hypothetical protein
MKECILCKDLFHLQCLKQLANYWEELKQNVVFLCPFCRRTKRPEVKAVTASLQKLQKLQAKTLESVAMQCLLDREIKWKELVNDLLKTPEMMTLYKAATDQKPKSTRSARITLSGENKSILETLLFRGFLLELDVPENELIYKILHKLDEEPSANKVSNFDQKAVDIELTNETCSLENELSASYTLTSAKEKERKSPRTFSREMDENGEKHVIKCQLTALGKKKMPTLTTMCKRKRVDKSISRDVGMNGMFNGIEMENDKQKNITDVEEEEETECEAKECLKPTGEHVDWVQCDYCKNWLHMICIGVTKGEVDDQIEFMCSLCKNEESPKSKNANENEEDDDDILFMESFTSQNATICSS